MKEAKQYGWESSKPTCSHEFIQPKIVSILKRLCREDKTILDVGCGNGAICGSLAALGFKVAGAEYDRQGFEIASRSYPEIKFYNVGVYDSSEEIRKDYPAGFDCVISTEVIEHLFSPQYLPLFCQRTFEKKWIFNIEYTLSWFFKKLGSFHSQSLGCTSHSSTGRRAYQILES